MTTKQKAKAYNKLFIKAKQIYNKENDVLITHTIEDLFPELKESEDEKIRKELLEHCINRRDGKQVCVDASDYRRWADWLFRQAVENIPILPYVKSDKEISNEIIEFLKLPHPQFVGKRHQEEWIAWLEKQGETKSDSFCREHCKGFQDTGKCFADGDCKAKREAESIDKVEPKFHEGEWCIDNEDDTIFQIVKVLDNTYTYRTNEGKEYSCTHYSLENDARLWTIQDAKDGDVLASKDKLNILIFRNLDTSTSFSSYYNIAGKGELGWSNECFIPATKEQRDLLFQKMKEAGYEWDDEKKELKIIDWSKHIKYEPNGPSIIKENLAWSEEDEKNLEGIIDEIEANKCHAPYYEHATYDRFLSWLKSLKDRHTWKPSDEQLEALESATENCAYSEYQDCLRKLIKQLKKLRKE